MHRSFRKCLGLASKLSHSSVAASPIGLVGPNWLRWRVARALAAPTSFLLFGGPAPSASGLVSVISLFTHSDVRRSPGLSCPAGDSLSDHLQTICRPHNATTLLNLGYLLFFGQFSLLFVCILSRSLFGGCWLPHAQKAAVFACSLVVSHSYSHASFLVSIFLSFLPIAPSHSLFPLCSSFFISFFSFSPSFPL